MKKTLIFLISAVLCAGLNFSQEDPEKDRPGRWYRAVEFGVTETAPINISLKAGWEKIYASLYFSYNQFESGLSNQILYGIGLGSIFSVDKVFFLNPEFIFSWGAGEDFTMYLGVVPYFGFNLPYDMAILFGPSLSWAAGKRRGPSFLKLSEYKINEGHALSLNGRVALRLLW
jgi:hypothetical protein